MTTARKHFMQADTIGTFHIVTRCVRRAFIQGHDEYSGKDYSHRKNWITDRLKFLLKSFAIDVGSYAVMDNHYHLVLRNRPDLLKNLTSEQIFYSWLILHPSKAMRNENRITPTSDDIRFISSKYNVEEIRLRLSDISWLMRELNQYIAVKANQEDQCKGAFWEARFKSQFLADDAAILTCMIYCDLNPIRAKTADSIESSIHTSGYTRYKAIEAKNNVENAKNLVANESKKTLSQLQINEIVEQIKASKKDNWLASLGVLDLKLTDNSKKHFLKISTEDYLDLLDTTGRDYHKNKPGIISGKVAPILLAMGLNQKQWLAKLKNYGKWYYRVLGPLFALKDKLLTVKQNWFKGYKNWGNPPTEATATT